MKVTLLDTKTGETREVTGEDFFYWTDGNGSCDCNRENPFELPEGDFDDGAEEGTGGGHCVGGKRFLVIAAEYEDHEEYKNPFTLAEMNPGYPDELLAEHGILQLAPSPENITQFVPGQEESIHSKVARENFNSADWPDQMSKIKASEEAGQNEVAEPVSEEYICLHEDFNGALLGVSVHPVRPTVAVYSIELLLAIIMSSELVGREMALLNVRTMMETVNADLKERAPVFVDDYEFVKSKKKASEDEGPKIIV